LTTLDTLGIKYTTSIKTYSNYVDAFFSVPLFQLENQQIANFLLGNRLLPARLFPSAVNSSDNQVTSSKDLETLTAIWKDISKKGGIILDALSKFDVALTSNPPGWNAVHPAWREALHTVVAIIPMVNGQSLDLISENQRIVTRDFIEPLRQLTPGGGAYLNEVRLLKFCHANFEVP
jgi:hypothetical protein